MTPVSWFRQGGAADFDTIGEARGPRAAARGSGSDREAPPAGAWWCVLRRWVVCEAGEVEVVEGWTPAGGEAAV